jgi:hypothetical protein
MAIFITLRIDCLSVNSFEPLTFVCERENCTATGRFYKKYGTGSFRPLSRFAPIPVRPGSFRPHLLIVL